MEINDLSKLECDLRDIGFEIKPSCYLCKHRRVLHWTRGYRCNVIPREDLEKDEISVDTEIKNKKAIGGVEFDNYAVINGLANWPNNFDPAWLTSCYFYERGEPT